MRAGRRSAALRRAVLERAFRGELVRHDPSDEPATVLLDPGRDDAAPGRYGFEGRVAPTDISERYLGKRVPVEDLTCARPGCTVTVRIDPAAVIAESNEDNNTAVASYSPGPG